MKQPFADIRYSQRYKSGYEKTGGAIDAVTDFAVTAVCMAGATYAASLALEKLYQWWNEPPKSRVVISGSLTPSTAKDVVKQVTHAKGDLDVILDTPGGSYICAFAIANALYEYKRGSIRVWIPYMAASSGTFIVMRLLGRSDVTVTLGEFASLSPFDVQSSSGINLKMVRELERREQKEAVGIYAQTPTLVHFGVDIMKYMEPLLARLSDEKMRDRVKSEMINAEQHDHEYLFPRSVILEMGIPISKDYVMPSFVDASLS